MPPPCKRGDLVTQSHHDLYDQALSDLAELQARTAANQTEITKHIARSRVLIEESRELIARADDMLRRLTPFVGPPR